MKGKIGQRFLETLRPGDKPYWVFDEVLPGFVLRVQPSGGMSYYVRTRTKGGREVSISLGAASNYTQQEIADAVGCSEQPVKDVVSDISASLPENLKPAALHLTDTQDVLSRRPKAA